MRAKVRGKIVSPTGLEYKVKLNVELDDPCDLCDEDDVDEAVITDLDELKLIVDSLGYSDRRINALGFCDRLRRAKEIADTLLAGFCED